MKKLLFAAAAFGALGLAGTANAASYNGYNDINRTERNIEQRINMGVRNHDVTNREANYLRGELRQIERLEAQYRRGGLSRWERADLNRRLDVLSAKVRFERHDRDHRGDGHRDRQGPSRW
jgi:hypothetical protein